MMKPSLTPLLLYVLLLCGRFAVGHRFCDSTPPPLTSHSLRYDMLSTPNGTWELMQMHHQLHHDHHHNHDHVTQTDDSAWSKLRPRKLLKEEDRDDWDMMYRKIKNMGLNPPKGFLKEVPLHDVRLNEGTIHATGQHTNLQYLLMLDIDSLLWSFRKTAGLPTPGTPYGGWEQPIVELRGHFVGHYLSATALMWASTNNAVLKERMTALVGNLSICQQKMGTGYLAAFPSELFDRYEAVKFVWAPYYSVHKIMAGLLDQYKFAGNEEALKITTRMADYFYKRVQNVLKKYTVERHYAAMNEEVGAMNDVLYTLFHYTGNTKYLVLAHLFDKPCFLGLLAVQASNIAGFHTNTHIPVLVGAQNRYEITGDPIYRELSTYFVDLINSSHAYATGGSSVSEHWREPKRIASALNSENEELCTSYNMLKVIRNLFRWTKDISYADYYERLLTNGILSRQRGTEPGLMIYMLPQGRGVSKARSLRGWGKKFDSFWCCYGTGSESFSKLGDSIYFEEEEQKDPTLYIIQYISTTFNWKSGNMIINQSVDPIVSWDNDLHVTFTFTTSQKTGVQSTLNLRIPSWTHLKGAKAMVNDETLTLPAPGNYMTISRKWFPGDKFTLQFPMIPRLEHVRDDRPENANIHAIIYGPFVLVGHSGGDWDLAAGPNKTITDWMVPVPESYNSHLITLGQDIKNSTSVLSNGGDHVFRMQNPPEPGTDDSLHTTYRLVSENENQDLPKFGSLLDAIGKNVKLEPINLPGMYVTYQGDEHPLTVVDGKNGQATCVFKMKAGLDGRKDAISLEAASQEGCFVHSGSGSEGVQLRCKSYNTTDSTAEVAFNKAVSFTAMKGVSEYHPSSFFAKGTNRYYLLEPLLKFRDEPYTEYFNIQ